MALTAALLGWMFDGLEMGLFPLVARPAISDLLDTASDAQVGKWFAVATACFLIGAATGGVLFGWLGDRLGRVRAMTVSVMTYALFSGLCGLANSPEQIAILRFVSALGMGGEWALGVALVMEIWPDNSRALLAGLIGAAANFGYMLVAVLGLGLESLLPSIESTLMNLGVPTDTAQLLVSHSGWRLLLMLGAAPALLTFFIRLFVPESERWQREQGKGATSHWGTVDLAGVGVGALAALGMIWLWADDRIGLLVRVVGSLAALAIITLGFLFPVIRYLQRLNATSAGAGDTRAILRRMLLGACLGGVPLLATWASIQWASVWADQLAENAARTQIVAPGEAPSPKVNAKAYTQFWSALGAVGGSLLGALLGGWLGRRMAYSLLCVSSLAACLWFFRGNDHFGPAFLVSIFVAGGLSATFYGWLPLYLPELFPTNVRATGQGFSFNFGRIIAAVGALQTSSLMSLFEGGYPEACSIMSLIYLVGLAVIWLAPETRGQPLPA
jgi:MFS transporter, SHS family, sialic acid transporter